MVPVSSSTVPLIPPPPQSMASVLIELGSIGRDSQAVTIRKSAVNGEALG
jgi:hypothetical protein